MTPSSVSVGGLFVAISAIAVLFGIRIHLPAATFITADVDVRYRYRDTVHQGELTAAGLGFRQVFADRSGDRLTIFLFGEAMHNLRVLMLEQAYLLYKGPLGAWNISVGRLTLPFGLLPDYPSKRLLLRTLESDTLGMTSDSGLMLSGVIRDFDYAGAVTQGVGVSGWQPIHGSGLISGRLGWLGMEDHGFSPGVSGAYGATIPDAEHDSAHDTARQPVERQLAAVDAIWYHGTRVFRAEIAGGSVNAHPFFGAFWGVDIGVAPAVDFTVGHRFVQRGDTRSFSVTGGFSLKDVFGFQVRAAQEYYFIGEGAHAFMVQVYRAFAFSR